MEVAADAAYHPLGRRLGGGELSQLVIAEMG
jgi:hypothetical protein